MITLSKKNTRKIKVEATEPGDFTEITKHTFTAEFKIIPNDEWKQLLEDDAQLHDVLKRGLVNVEGVADDAGKELPFTSDLVEALLSEPWIVAPLFKAQMAVQGGVSQSELYKKERRKN